QMGLRGFVLNSTAGLVVEIEGERKQVHGFERRLETERPAAAVVLAREVSRLAPAGYRGFEIRSSDSSRPKAAGVLPDLATCAECLEELFDPANRRFRYPFINCTKCGPRYTIIDDIPYDRSASRMRNFKLCSECARECGEPQDRRFHAQPNACPSCGPSIQPS